MSLESSVLYYQDTAGTAGFFGWEEFKQKPFSLDPYCHSLHYAKGVFEGIRAVWGKNPEGLHFITFPEHLQRLAGSSRYLRLMEVNPEQLQLTVEELIKRNIAANFLNPQDGCYVRPIIFSDKKFDGEGRQVHGMGVYSGEHRKAMLITLFPWGAYLEGPPRLRVYEAGIASPLRKHKTCANYGFNGLAKDTAVDEGYDEALITDPSPKRNVLEGGGENVFLLDQGGWVTPGTDQDILPGTKRRVLIEMLKNYGTLPTERKIPLKEFMRGEAAVFTGTAAGVVAIKSVYNHLTSQEHEFNLDSRIMPASSLTLSDLAEQYQRLITGEPVAPVQKKLQKKVRTFLRI